MISLPRPLGMVFSMKGQSLCLLPGDRLEASKAPDATPEPRPQLMLKHELREELYALQPKPVTDGYSSYVGLNTTQPSFSTKKQ
jgi:hypothetical protein